MRARRCLFRIVVLCGFLAGLWALLVVLDRDTGRALYNSLSDLRNYERFSELHDGHMRRLHPGAPSLLTGESPDFYLDLFNRHPDRLWHLWRWAYSHPAMREVGIDGKRPVPLSRRDEETRRQAAEFADIVQKLREADPDNGYPLIMQAWLETAEAVIEVKENKDGYPVRIVVDPVRAAKAAELLRRAVTSRRCTYYSAEEGAEWMRILGAPRTYDESLTALAQGSMPLLPHMRLLSFIAENLAAEAGRRAQRPGEEADALVILHDLQTFGARFAIDARPLLSSMIGLSAIRTATEEGIQVLLDAGRMEEAQSLLERGQRLLRPRLLAVLMSRDDLDKLEAGSTGQRIDVLEDDQELIDEAKRLLAERRENIRLGVAADLERYGGGDVSRAGNLLRNSMPGITSLMPYTESPISLDELRTASRFELWGEQKHLTAVLAACACGFLAALLILHGILSRRCADPVPENWPAPGEMLGGSLLFALVAAGPGLASAFAGNFLWELTERHIPWHRFWNVWGALAACAALALWTNRSVYGRRFALIGLFAAVPLAYLVYSGALFAELPGFPSLWRGFLFPPRLAMLVLLLPVPLWGAALFVRWFRAFRKGGADGASALPALRRFLACASGGLVLWLAAAGVITDWQDRKWTGRDTLLAPTESAVGFSPIEFRIVDFHRRHLEKVLTEE